MMRRGLPAPAVALVIAGAVLVSAVGPVLSAALAPPPTGYNGVHTAGIVVDEVGHPTLWSPGVAPPARVGVAATALPYGFSVTGMGTTSAGVVSGVGFDEGNDSTCANPTSNTSIAEPLHLSGVPTFICLNAANSGTIRSTWSDGLVNSTSYNLSGVVRAGCAPIPPATNSTGCAFFGSNRFTGYLSNWTEGSPTNSSTVWEPDATGLSPSDAVYAMTLAVNGSGPHSTVYQLSVALTGATPIAQEFYVESPATSEPSQVTILFDETLAWLTSPVGNGSAATIYPVVSAAPTSVGYATPCSLCYVTFTETGLASGFDWSVAVDNRSVEQNRTSPSAAISFALPNGTYPYSIYLFSGCVADPSTGSLGVAGSDVDVALDLARSNCSVAFVEAGLSGGTTWAVALNGTTHAESVPVIDFEPPYGTYEYRVDPVSGYQAAPTSGTVIALGTSSLIEISFTRVAAPPPGTSLATILTLGMGLGAAAVAGVVVLVIRRMRSTK